MKYLTSFVICVIACASAAPSTRITGGADAARNQFPYQVSLQWGLIGVWQHICGGSILSFNRVLTAGHCITDVPTIGRLRIRAGILNLDDNFVGLQEVDIASSVVHPNYTGGIGPNDLAILVLSSSFTLTESVQPISLPTEGETQIGNATLSGWGSTSTTETSVVPNTLQYATVPIITNLECGAFFDALVPLTNICTGSGPGPTGLSACSGDSGGPLVQNNLLIGVVSWGFIPCGIVDAPSVYVRISSFITWITDNLM